MKAAAAVHLNPAKLTVLLERTGGDLEALRVLLGLFAVGATEEIPFEPRAVARAAGIKGGGRAIAPMIGRLAGRLGAGGLGLIELRTTPRGEHVRIVGLPPGLVIIHAASSAPSESTAARTHRVPLMTDAIALRDGAATTLRESGGKIIADLTDALLHRLVELGKAELRIDTQIAIYENILSLLVRFGESATRGALTSAGYNLTSHKPIPYLEETARRLAEKGVTGARQGDATRLPAQGKSAGRRPEPSAQAAEARRAQAEARRRAIDSLPDL